MNKVTKVAKIAISKTIKTESKYINYNTDKKSSDILDLIDDDDYDGGQCFKTVENEKINFEISSTPFCCGLLEIGDLRYNSKNIDFLKLFLDAYVKKSSYTLMINTNGVEASIEFEKALEKSKYWQLVKIYKNPNSKNTLKLWISKN